MAGPDCIKRVWEMSEELLSKQQAKKLLDDFERDARYIAQKTGKPIEDAMKDVRLRRQYDLQVESAIQKRNKLINLDVDERNAAKIAAYKEYGLNDARAVRGMIVGESKAVADGKYSCDVQHKTLVKKYITSFFAPIEKMGYTQTLTSGKFDRDIAIEYQRLTSKTNAPESTGNKEAAFIAQQYFKAAESLRLEKNRAGAFIRTLDGYAGAQTYDASAIERAGFSKWASDVAPLVDWDKTLRPGMSANDFLKQAYESIVSGKTYEFGSGANLAAKMSQGREIFFKDADSWLQHEKNYGYGKTLAQTFFYTLERGSRDLMLMRNFGTNPEAGFKRMLGKLDIAEQEARSLLNKYYYNLDGRLNNPLNPTIAQIGNAISTWNNVRLLGKAIFSSLPDSMSKVIELQHQGVANFFQAFGRTISDLAPFGNEANAKIASLFGVGMESKLGHVLSQIYAFDGLPGKMSELQRIFFKLNLMNWWNDANKTGTAAFMSHSLALERGNAFKDLDPKMLNLFKQYGITENHWNTIRQFSMVEGGREYITPELIEGAELSRFASLTGKGLESSENELAKARSDVAERLRAYVIDRADYATLTPGLKEKVLLNQGTQRGTYFGEALRLFMQFKSYPVAFITKMYGRAFEQGKADIPQLVQLVLGMTAMGYVADSLSALSQGKTPPPVLSSDEMLSAFIRGGGGGIYADLLMSNRVGIGGQSWADVMAGPTVAAINDFMDFKRRAINGEANSKDWQALTRTVPLQNIWFRSALDYMVFNQVRGMYDPGFQNRLRDYAEKQGQSYFIAPNAQMFGGQP